MANQPTKYRKFVVGAASAALVASAVAPVASAAEFKDTKGNTHEDAINALVEAGVITGYEDGTFKPNKTLTRSDVVKMMGKWLVSLGYEVPADYKTNPRFTDQTSSTNEELLKYSALVKDHGVFNGYENGSLGAAGDITRENMAIVLVRAYDAINKTDLVAFVKEQNFKKDVTDLATAKAEARPYIDVLDYFDITNPAAPQFNPKATTTRGQFASFLYKTSKAEAVTPVVTATKVASVSATNLKEVVVTFDGTVDAKTAGNEDNYSINGGLTVETAVLSEDGKSVVLTLASKMTNQNEYELTVKNVKAGDKVIAVANFAFTPLDTTLPTVEKVEALGNKAVRVTFSEPIDSTTVQIGDFKLDDKAIAGTVEADNGRTVIVKTYTKLADGEHTLAISGVKDFADYTIVSTSQKFNVVEDVTAPTIAEISATFESVTVKFSEPVQNVKGGSYAYWKTNKDSTVKHNSSTTVTKLADDTYRFEFTNADKLPGYEVLFYATGVKDYSDNTIASDTPVAVSAVIDQTRPEVTSVSLNEDTYKSIEVKFSKAISNITNRASYVLKDKAGRTVSVRGITAGANDRSATIELYSALGEGTYTLSLEGLKDKTTLQNSILPYTHTLEVADNEAPELEGVAKEGRYITVQFSEEMALEGTGSIANLSAYLIQYKGTFRALPAGTSIQVLDGADAVMLILPEKIDGVNYDAAQLTAVTVQGVKDANGNVLKNYSATETNLASTFTIATKSNGAPNVTLVDPNTINVIFNQAIGTGVTATDFTVANNIVDSAEVDGNKVTLTLRNDMYSTAATSVSFSAGAFKSILGTDVSVATTVAVVDAVKPELVEITNTTANELVLDFTEDILGTYATEMATDLVVTRVNGGKELLPTVDYTTAVVGGDIVVTLVPTADNVKGKDSIYTVALKSTNTFVTDVASNKAVVFGATAAPNNLDLAAPTVSIPEATGSNNNATKLVVTYNEPLYNNTTALASGDVKSLFAYDGTAANYTSATYDANARTVTFVFTGAEDGKKLTTDANVKDAGGNAPASTVFTYANTGTVWSKN